MFKKEQMMKTTLLILSLIFIIGIVFTIVKLNSIHSAVRANWYNHVEKILENNPERLNEKDKAGETPLMHAAKFGNIETVELLIKRGADVNTVCDGGGTALHMAAWFGYKDVVEILIKSSANKEAKEDGGATPFDYAKKAGHKGIVNLLNF